MASGDPERRSWRAKACQRSSKHKGHMLKVALRSVTTWLRRSPQVARQVAPYICYSLCCE